MLKRCLIACMLLCLPACSNVPDGPRTVPCEGTVYLDGEPVDGAVVVFVSSAGTEYSASGPADKNGNFSLNAFPYKSGAVPGEYIAMVKKDVEITSQPKGKANAEEKEHAEEGGGEQLGVKNIMPAKYAQPTPLLSFTVPEDGVKDLKIELTSD